MKLKNYVQIVSVMLLAFLLTACGGTATQEALPTEANADDDTSASTDPTPTREDTSEVDMETDDDMTSDVDLTIELPDVPADLDGGTITVTSIEGGFSIEDAPIRLLQGMCFGTVQGFVFDDDTTNAPPSADMTINIAPETTPGTYELVFNNPENDPTLVMFGGNIHEEDAEGVTQFTTLESGVIRIDSLPTADGETFTGALQMTMSSGEERIQVDAVFNVTLSGDELCGDDA